jgi:hypothetical protein
MTGRPATRTDSTPQTGSYRRKMTGTSSSQAVLRRRRQRQPAATGLDLAKKKEEELNVQEEFLEKLDGFPEKVGKKLDVLEELGKVAVFLIKKKPEPNPPNWIVEQRDTEAAAAEEEAAQDKAFDEGQKQMREIVALWDEAAKLDGTDAVAKLQEALNIRPENPTTQELLAAAVAAATPVA